MVFHNQPQEAPVLPRRKTRYLDRQESTVPNAADILCFLRLASPAARQLDLESVITFARAIPALSGNILELHLAKKQIDFATRINQHFDRAFIAEAKRKPHRLSFAGKKLQTLFEQDDETVKGIENAWIEYDKPFRSEPALFFDVNKHDLLHPGILYNKLQNISNGFGCCVNERLPGFLQQVHAAGLHIVYFGLMFSRKTASIRLTIHGITAAKLAETMKYLGWTGNFRTLEELAADFLTKDQKIVVSVDLGNEVEGRIGIEVFDTDKLAFARTLANVGLISELDYSLFNTWEQQFQFPESLGTMLTQLFQRQIQWLHTRINHFKFVVDRSKAIELKSYLYYCF